MPCPSEVEGKQSWDCSTGNEQKTRGLWPSILLWLIFTVHVRQCIRRKQTVAKDVLAASCWEGRVLHESVFIYSCYLLRIPSLPHIRD